MREPHPTEGELAILRILWDRGTSCTVHEVHAALSLSKDTAYTTVLKMMTIMVDKGLLSRDESARRHLYSTVHPKPAVQSALVSDLMQRAFAGSALQLVQRALDVDATSPEDLNAIARMIAQAKAQRHKT